MGSFFVACSRPVKESLEGAKVCARPVLEMIRSAAPVTFKQTSLRTSASYAANPHSRQEIFFTFEGRRDRRTGAISLGRRSWDGRKQSLGDALGTASTHFGLSQLEDSVARTLAKAAGLVVKSANVFGRARLCRAGFICVKD